MTAYNPHKLFINQLLAMTEQNATVGHVPIKTSTLKLILIIIANNCDYGPITIEKLSTLASVSTKTAYNATRWLEQHRYLARDGTGENCLWSVYLDPTKNRTAPFRFHQYKEKGPVT